MFKRLTDFKRFAVVMIRLAVDIPGGVCELNLGLNLVLQTIRQLGRRSSLCEGNKEGNSGRDGKGPHFEDSDARRFGEACWKMALD